MNDLAMDIIQNRVFLASQAPDELLSSLFLPIALGSFAEWTKEELKQIGMIFEYYTGASELAVNGYPSFMSYRIIHAEDWPIVWDKVKALAEAMKTTLEKPHA